MDPILAIVIIISIAAVVEYIIYRKGDGGGDGA
jgi:hypothetical protein